VDCPRLALWEKAISRALADDTLGEVVVRRLSRGSQVVMGVSPYIRCMYPPDDGGDNGGSQLPMCVTANRLE